MKSDATEVGLLYVLLNSGVDRSAAKQPYLVAVVPDCASSAVNTEYIHRASQVLLPTDRVSADACGVVTEQYNSLYIHLSPTAVGRPESYT